MSSQTVLFAWPEEWIEPMKNDVLPIDYFRARGFDIIEAFSYEDALKIIRSQNLSAVVMVSDWAMKQDDGSPGLMEFLRDKVPTYSLITETTRQKVGYGWMDELHMGRQHEYQSVPADPDAIVVWLSQILHNDG